MSSAFVNQKVLVTHMRFIYETWCHRF